MKNNKLILASFASALLMTVPVMSADEDMKKEPSNSGPLTTAIVASGKIPTGSNPSVEQRRLKDQEYIAKLRQEIDYYEAANIKAKQKIAYLSAAIDREKKIAATSTAASAASAASASAAAPAKK